MRIISKARLRCFWNDQHEAELPLSAWYAHVRAKTVAWKSWADLKAEFASASLVGNCIVFNIGGNKFRLATRVFYRTSKVYVLKVMTHSEYDKNKWKDECGCYAEPRSRLTSREIRRMKPR